MPASVGRWSLQVGADLEVEKAAEAAKLVAINLMTTMKGVRAPKYLTLQRGDTTVAKTAVTGLLDTMISAVLLLGSVHSDTFFAGSLVWGGSWKLAAMISPQPPSRTFS